MTAQPVVSPEDQEKVARFVARVAAHFGSPVTISYRSQKPKSTGGDMDDEILSEGGEG